MSSVHGGDYRDWLSEVHEEAHGNADVAAHFFRRAFDSVRQEGAVGFVTTNSISQGDTRETGLLWIRNHGGDLYNAHRRYKWVGDVAVVVSIVHVLKGTFAGSKFLDGTKVDTITAFLFHAGGDESPKRLATLSGYSFNGSKVYGAGFTFDDKDSKGLASSIDGMHQLISQNPHNADRIFPYICGADVNDSPKHSPLRFVIDFGSMSLEDARNQWPDLVAIVEQKVRPERAKVKRAKCRDNWWLFERRRDKLYDTIKPLKKVLVFSRVNPQFSFTFLDPRVIFADSLVVFAYQDLSAFATLQSSVHERWARFMGSSMKDDLRYTPSDCFDTFPFPASWDDDSNLEETSREYYDYRAELMVRNDEGLTKTYNRFHAPGEASPDIHKLRLLHAAMDRAVLDAYGWKDVPTGCEFIPDFTEEDDDGNEIPKNIRYRWPDEVRDDVLARLLVLNAERYQAEVNAGLHAVKKTARKKRAARESTAGPSEEPRTQVSPESQGHLNFES